MTGVTYPAWAYPGSVYLYAYDAMGRLNTMQDYLQFYSPFLVSGVTYTPSNAISQITATSGAVNAQTRDHNSLGQLTGINSGA